jgi:hypothetical protein
MAPQPFAHGFPLSIRESATLNCPMVVRLGRPAQRCTQCDLNLTLRFFHGCGELLNAICHLVDFFKALLEPLCEDKLVVACKAGHAVANAQHFVCEELNDWQSDHLEQLKPNSHQRSTKSKIQTCTSERQRSPNREETERT